MTTNAKGTFLLKSWEEKPCAEIEGTPRVTRYSSAIEFHGDIEGKGFVDGLIMYHTPESAGFIELQRIIGEIDGCSGTFVIQSTGTYENESAKATWVVMPGSGTGELVGLRGEGGFIALRGPQAAFTLDYEFDDTPDEPPKDIPIENRF